MSKSAGQKITLLISDSSRMGCQLLANALKFSRHNFHVASYVTTSKELLAAIREQEPQVAVISSNLQDGALSGIRVLREVHSSYPDLSIIALLDSSDRDMVIDAFRGGATGIFCRAGSPDELCKCICAVHQGQVWASSTELKFLLEAFKNAVPMRPADVNGNRLLTQREEQVVSLVAEGMSNREISAELRLSEHTIKNYMFRIFNKLGISSRVELILYALNHNGTVVMSGAETANSTNTMQPVANRPKSPSATAPTAASKGSVASPKTQIAA